MDPRVDDRDDDELFTITDEALLAAREDAEMRLKAREAALSELQERSGGWRRRRRAAAEVGPLHVDPEWLVSLIDEHREHAALLRVHGLLPPS